MTECESLPLLSEDRGLLMAEDAQDDVAVSAMYYVCATRQRGLIKWVREVLVPNLQRE